MRKHIDFTVIIVLFFLLIICFLSNMKMSGQINRLKTTEVLLSSYLDLKRENIAKEVASASFSMNSLLLKNNAGDTIMFSEISKGTLPHFRLVFRCDRSNCESCMREITSRLKQVIESGYLNKNVIILGNYSTDNDLRTHINYWGINEVYSIVECEDSNDFVINKPHFYLIDGDNLIRNVFIPNAYDVKELDVYLKTVSNLLIATQ